MAAVNDVYVFGDSHWRVFFPFVNHGAATDNISHEQDGVRTIDTIANELSGSTMYGLLNPSSRHGARNRILDTIDRLGGVDNVGLVFGEVDARFHHERYFVNGHLSMGRIHETVARYSRFICDDLILSRRVRNKIFVYHVFSYPKMGETLLQPSQPIGRDGYLRAEMVNARIKAALHSLYDLGGRVHVIQNDDPVVSDDGVHLIPEETYAKVLSRMVQVFDRDNFSP